MSTDDRDDLVGDVADALTLDQKVQWERCARLAAGADREKIENLRVIERVLASRPVAGQASETAEATRTYGSAVVRRAVHVLIAIATIEVAATLLLLPWARGDYLREHGEVAVFMTTKFVGHAAAAGLLLWAGRGDWRTWLLGVYCLLKATQAPTHMLPAFVLEVPAAAAYAAYLQHLPADSRLLLALHVPVFLFAPAFLWAFAREYPRVHRRIRLDDLARRMIPGSVLIGGGLWVACAVTLELARAGYAAAPVALVLDGTIAAQDLLVLGAVTLVALRAHTAPADEVRRVVVFSAGFLLFMGVSSVYDVAEAFAPGDWVSNYRWSPTVLLMEALRFPGLILLWYAVLAARIPHLREAVRALYRRLLMRPGLLGALAAVPAAALAWLIGGNPERAVGAVIADPLAQSLFAVVGLLLLVIAARERILIRLDAWILPETADQRQALADAAGALAQASRITTVGETVTRTVRRGCGSPATLLVADDAGTHAGGFSAPRARIAPLPRQSAIVHLLETAGGPVRVEPAGRPRPPSPSRWPSSPGTRSRTFFKFFSACLSGSLLPYVIRRITKVRVVFCPKRHGVATRTEVRGPTQARKDKQNLRQTGVQGPEAGWGGPERGSSRSPLGRPGPYPRLIAGLALAVPFVIMPMPAQAQGNAQSATYRVTFEGKFTASALASGVSVPSGEHFTTLIGAVHNDSVTFWSSGGMASAGIESMAEVGGTSALKSEINASSNALAVIEKSLPSGGTPTATVDFTVTTAHPLVTLLSMIAPSPDWFVGVSGLSLRNDADDGWQPSLTVDLFPYDAGTEEGTEFSLSNAATSPQGTIASIKGTGKFSNEPIATLSFLRLTPLITSPSLFAVDENGTAVATLSATDTETDSDELTWSIPSGDAGGADADKFTLSSTGVLTFNAAKDYENPDDSDTDRTYEVTVQVSDGDNTDTATLTVTVENVIELTTLTGPSSSDYAENGATRVATYTASSDEDRDGIDWILTGNDARHFTIDSPRGALRFDIAPVAPKIFAEPPDFEDPDDTDTNNDYEVTLLARVGTTLSSTLSVTVTVTDVDEDGAITLSTTRPRMGEALAATLVDPDGVTGAVAYSWERSASRSAWVTITGANTASYTPAAAETGHFLRVTATYTDGHGADNTATATAAEVVTAQLLSGLTATTTNSTGGATWRQMNPAFDAHTLHYAVGCGDSDTMTVTLTAADSAARVAVDLRQTANRNTTVEVAVTGSSDVPITLTGTDGAHTTYVVHCIPDDFMEVTTIKRVNTGVMEDLIMFGRHYGDDGGRQDGKTYMTIIDNNGVPRFLRPLEYRVSLFFRYHKTEDGPWRYSHGKGNNLDGEIVILNQNLEEVTRVTTVAPLTKTNYHDHHILDDGNYLLMSYQPETRDLSHLVGFLDRNGDPMTYGMAEDVSDSAIQIVTPDSKAVFTWNSWDGMEIEDCAAHRFPPAFMDYAHVNGLQLFDGDIIATFRGCSKVLRIDPDPNNDTDHKVVWRLGRSNLSDEQWLAGDKGPPPMKFVGDPEGEFCGMHAGKLLPNGNLLIFDNGTDCLIDPRTRVSQRVSNEFSRAVEYAIDEVNGEAIYLRAHSLHGTEAYLTWSSGNVEYLANGDWLISWGRSPTTAQVEGGSGAKPDESATQVDPDTGVEKFSIRVTNTGTAGGQQGIRAIPLSPVALADEPVPLAAEIVESAASSVFHLGPTDAPQVVVAFNQPVVDPDPAATTWPWVNVQGATIESVVSHIVPGEPANAYLFTLTPTGVGPITFGLVADPPCASGGICTADGTLLSEAPASHVIPARPTGPHVMSITSSATHPTKDGFTVTITFSEPVTGLTANEIEVTHGTGSNFSGSGAVYTLEIAPNAGIEGDVTVTVTAGAVVDGVNNGNPEVSEAFAVDTKAPTVSRVAISSDPGSDRLYVAEDEIQVTVTFSETVVVAGTLRLTLNVGGGNRTANYQSGVDATLLFSYMVADGESDADGVSIEANRLTLNGGTIRDGSNNNAVLDHEEVAPDSGHKVDAVKPRLAASGGAVVDGTRLTLTYDEALDGGSRPVSGDFTVSGGDRARAVTGVRVNGSAVELTLDVGAEHGEAGIQVSYTPGANPIQDVPGNDAEALSREPVTNDTPDTTSPTVSSLAITSNPGGGSDLCGGGRDRGDGDLQRDGGSDEDAANAAESGEQEPDGRLPERQWRGGAGVQLRGGPGGRRHRWSEHCCRPH